MLKSLLAASLSLFLAIGLVGPAAAEENYPSRDVYFLCSFPAGSGADVLVRFFANKISQEIGRTVVVENKPGAGGMLALTYLAQAKPDGYTILLDGGNAVAINANLLKNPPIDAGRDIRVAATLNRMPFLLAVSGTSPYKNLTELTEAMKKAGPEATYAYSSPFAKVIGESYKVAANLKTVDVAYKSIVDSLNDIASGSIDFAIFDPVQGLARQKDGKLKILAISTASRTHATGDLPTFREQGLDVDLSGWWAALVPAGTPGPIVEKINAWFKNISDDGDVRTFLANAGADSFHLSASEANAFYLEEIVSWGRLVEMAKIEKN